MRFRPMLPTRPAPRHFALALALTIAGQTVFSRNSRAQFQPGVRPSPAAKPTPAKPTPAKPTAKQTPPKSPPAPAINTERFYRALRAQQAQRYGEAEKLYRAILATEPNSAVAWANLGLVLAASGQTNEAIRSLKKAAALEPKTAEFSARLATLLWADSRVVEAIDASRSALKVDPNNKTALSILAGALFAQEKFADAVSPLKKLNELEKGKNPQTLGALVTALAADGKKTDALVFARKLAIAAPKTAAAHLLRGDLAGQLGAETKNRALFTEARAAYNLAFSLDPNNSRAGINAAIAAEALGDFASARVTYSRIIRKFPDEARAHYGIGRLILLDTNLTPLDRAKNAQPSLERASTLSPKTPEYTIAFAFSLLAQDGPNIEKAIGVFKGALSVAPNDERALRGIADAYGKNKQPDQAIATHKTLLTLRPDDYNLRHNLANLYLQTGKKSEGYAELRNLAKRNPKDIRALKELALYLEQDNKLESSRETFEEVIARAPKDANLLTSLGLVLEKLGRTDDARKRYEEAVSAAPGDEAANIALVTLLTSQGKLDAVLPLRERLVAADPKNNRARWALAQEYQRVGRDDDALKQMRAITLRKDDENRMMYRLGPANLFQLRKRHDEEVAELRRLRDEEPEVDGFAFSYADALERAGKLEMAERELNALQKKAKPGDIRPRLGIAGMRERAGRLDEAALAFEDLVQLRSQNVDAREGLRRVRAAQKKPELALEFFEKIALADADEPDLNLIGAIDLYSLANKTPEKYLELTKKLAARYPKHTPSLLLRAQAITRTQPGATEKQEAIELYARVAKLDPKNFDPPYQQGRLLQELGRKDDAIAAFQESARRNPRGPASAALLALGAQPPGAAGPEPPPAR